MKRLLTIISCLFFTLMVYAQKPYTIIKDGQKITCTAANLKPYIQNTLIDKAKELNKQLPLKVDEYTTLVAVIVSGNALCYNYRVDIEKEYLTQSDVNDLIKEIKETGKENLRFLFQTQADVMPANEWKRLFTELGIYYVYTYFDINNKAFARINIYPKDL